LLRPQFESVSSMDLNVFTYGNPEADRLLVQMVDDHDMSLIENEVSLIRDLTGGQDFCLKAVKVNSWNQDLSPWPAPAVFGEEAFGDGASNTLAFVLNHVITREGERTSGADSPENRVSGTNVPAYMH